MFSLKWACDVLSSEVLVSKVVTSVVSEGFV